MKYPTKIYETLRIKRPSLTDLEIEAMSRATIGSHIKTDYPEIYAQYKKEIYGI